MPFWLGADVEEWFLETVGDEAGPGNSRRGDSGDRITRNLLATDRLDKALHDGGTACRETQEEAAIAVNWGTDPRGPAEGGAGTDCYATGLPEPARDGCRRLILLVGHHMSYRENVLNLQVEEFER